LSAKINVNGLDAWALFDSGSTANLITPSFAKAAGVTLFALSESVPLQLGTVGSKAKISYGAKVPLRFGPINVPDYYMDVANVADYDMIIGTVFMRHHHVSLDFATDQILVDNKPQPTMTLLEN
ncbi:hypothetical protein DL96DRAFT_1415247, partial [Flagelloscypha sp. PMI_526]